jgi:hypothetical protein
MATVYVPGVALTVLKGFIGTNPWAVTHHWQNGASITPWTQADLDLLCLTVFNAWGSALKGNTAVNVETHEVDGTDLTNASGVGSVYTHTPVFGLLSGGLQPSSLCMVVQNRIAARYRGGHPRSFWPVGTVSQFAGEALWSPTFVTSIANNVVSFVEAVRAPSYSFGSGVLNHVIPRYTYTMTDDPASHKWKRERTGLLSVNVVQSYFGVQKAGSQRKRLTP